MAANIRIGLVLQGDRRWAGGVEYIKNLAKALYQLLEVRPDACELRIFAPAGTDPTLLADMPERFHRELRATPARTSLIRTSVLPFDGNRRALCRLVRAERIDFVYPWIPGFGTPARYAAWIPDFQHRRLPHHFNWWERVRRDASYRRLLAFSERVVLSSAAAARDCERFFGGARARPEILRFTTTPLASWWACDPADVLARRGLPLKYFLVANQFWRHKNHEVVFDAVERLRSRGEAPVVLCTGALMDDRDPKRGERIMRDLARRGIGDLVKPLGLLPRLDQVALLRRALAVIQPSKFEGWSTVVEDARALGTPLLLSDIDVHQEQAPAGAEYFEPDDADRLANQMAKLWHGPQPVPRDAQQTDAAHRLRVLAFAQRFLGIATADRAA